MRGLALPMIGLALLLCGCPDDELPLGGQVTDGGAPDGALGQCLPGNADCDGDPSNGCEVYLAVDQYHCGTCGNACGLGSCEKGVCVMDAGPGCTAEVCDGLDNDCNGLVDDGANLCGAGKTCMNGACMGGACTAGFADCDADSSNGCETDLRIDKNNCGACASVCADACQAGVCVSDAGPGCSAEVCDGLDNNCNGQIDDGVNLCGPHQGCDSGACVCDAGFGDCDANTNNGCEVALDSDKNNCGACGQVCAGTCVNGICQ